MVHEAQRLSLADHGYLGLANVDVLSIDLEKSAYHKSYYALSQQNLSFDNNESIFF